MSRNWPFLSSLVFLCDLKFPDQVLNCVIIACGSTKTSSVLYCWSLWTAEGWGVSLRRQDKQLFCHVGNSRCDFFSHTIRLRFSHENNNNKQSCLESGGTQQSHTVRPNLMATWRPKLSFTVQLRLPKRIKVCGLTESSHQSTSSPPNNALLWLRRLDHSHLK